ncbi:ATP-binding protein [Pseudomonas syringae]|uniref:ATP-binding protein n=1 Tax=Pseudomonas syringae TaxID=317 RepID=UPI000E31DD8E|nr:ATP-binding protein [Pseudomonas syringae]
MDYRRIRGMDSGQRLAFEELVCQLARREPPAADAEFRRIEGAGGDGGIEAYWLLRDGSEVGFQAKYYLKAGDIDWANIDDSVKRALQSHPSLTKYVLALPCDLTDKTGKQGGGKRGWEHWEAHKATWASYVPPGHKVEFIPWTASELTNRLSLSNAEGLRRYWFGDVEFSPSWLSEKVEWAVKSLDERYHPEDHVEVGIERLFKVILHDQSIISELQSKIDKLCTLAKINNAEKQLGSASTSLMKSIASQVKKLGESGKKLTSDAWLTWPLAECLGCIEDISDNVHTLQSIAWKAKEEKRKEKTSSDHSLDYLQHQLSELSDASYELRSSLQDRYFSAEPSRSFFLYGKAGTGKSHLLGSIAQEAISDNRVAILILGQHLNSDSIWSQVTNRLGLGDIDPDVFLQALSAAAEVTGKRGLILIDALNEGSGITLWRKELAEFIGRIEKHQNLLVVFSCRIEYAPYVIPASVNEQVPSFQVRGFETKEEQTRAARIYLGKRGISQPNTPWLAAEFVNPLFLRSACIALEKENQKWFPRGLTGTKQVFSFYLRSIARNLGAGRDGSDDLVKPTNQALSVIATEMATKRSDYVQHSDAIKIVAEKFHAFPAPPGTTWFEVLQRNGLFRMDPNPKSKDADPFDTTEDIVRFSFQRLQDYLMASGLLDEVEDPAEALKSGSLQFIHNGKRLHGKWAGLTEALSVQLPERFQKELLDVIPGGVDHWANEHSVGSAFIESLRWRANESFSNRTLELFNSFLSESEEHFDIILQVSASAGHPWNAKSLHNRLAAQSMPERDASWTIQLNSLPMDEENTGQRLIEWSAFEQSEQTDSDIQYLCAITLTWFFASSNRELRDKATKALTSLMIWNPSLYGMLCMDFSRVDDLYVLERLHTAAYGACCIDPEPHRLHSYSVIANREVFDREDVPLSIILRDSALGIIELALLTGHLPEQVDIVKAMPPYHSKTIRFSVSEEALEKVAKRAGDSQILDSCTGWGGDFASYEIQPRVSSFLNVPLVSPEPLSATEIYERFEDEVINHCDLRTDVLKLMHDFSPNPFRDLRLHLSEQDVEESSINFTRAENLLMEVLSPDERVRYKKEYKKRFKSSRNDREQLPHIDINAAKRWVAKRAYGLGWTNKLFPHDRSHRHDYSRDRPLVERIGKKYQWLALDELLCSLADTRWLLERTEQGSRRYASPLDIGTHREIDPTILLTDEQSRAHIPHPSIENFQISIRETVEGDVGKWPFEEEPSIGMANLVSRTDSTRATWAVLHEHSSVTVRYEEKQGREHGSRQQQWRFLLPVIVRKEDEQQLLDYIRTKQKLDVDSWTARDFTNDGYLREAPWRSTWAQEQWSTYYFHDLGEIEVAYPCFRHYWEPHLDVSMPKGAQALIPAPWLAQRLNLKPHPEDATIYVDHTGETRFICGRSPGDGSHAFIDHQLFHAFLEEDELACVWIFVTERSAWPGGENKHASRRRSEGVVWHERSKPQMVYWSDDWARGDSEQYVPEKV